MPLNLVGYKYWAELMRYCEEDIGLSYRYKMMTLYNYLANKYNSTAYRVERQLRYAIQCTRNLYLKLNVDYKISNGIFLAKLTQRLEVYNNANSKI